MRYYSGYYINANGSHGANFEIRAASKKNAVKNLKDFEPNKKAIIKVSYKQKPEVSTRGIRWHSKTLKNKR
jgi:hypothetical protein